MIPTTKRKPSYSIERGVLLPFHTDRLFQALELYKYKPTLIGLKHARHAWKQRDGRLNSDHTLKKMCCYGMVAEGTRRAACDMLRDLGWSNRLRPDIAALLDKLEPEYFVLDNEVSAVMDCVCRYLKVFTEAYYRTQYCAWNAYSSLSGALGCITRAGTLLDRLTDEQQLLVARLTGEWIEAAHLSGAFQQSDLVSVYWIGRAAARRAECSCRPQAESALSLLEHASPIDECSRPAVSGLIWRQPLVKFDDQDIVRSVAKVDRARRHSLDGNGQVETAFSIGQLILRARLWTSSRGDSRTNDARRDLDQARGLLGLGTVRTRAYFSVVEHYYLCRLITVRSKEKDLRLRAAAAMREARRCYSDYLGTGHLHIAACNFRLAECSVGKPDPEEFTQSIETLLANPYDRSGVADLSALVDGSSPLFSKSGVDYDATAFATRSARRRAAYSTAE